MEWGAQIAFLEKRAAKGKPTPALDNRLELYPDLLDVWLCFRSLLRFRPRGMDISAIPVSEIKSWMDIHEIAEPERVTYFRLISALDDYWVKYERQQSEDKAERKRKGKNNGNTKTRNRR